MSDRDEEIVVPLGYDLKVKPTDEKLKDDAGSLVMQYLQFWLPGEVECTVVLSRPDSKQAIYATSITNRERLLVLMTSVRNESAVQTLLIRGREKQR